VDERGSGRERTRIAEVSTLVVETGLIVIASFILIQKRARMALTLFEAHEFIEIDEAIELVLEELRQRRLLTLA
jgi:adenylylsulfate kinase-like enzyme